MSKRKPGLSIEEKINRTEEYLQETRLPYTLKELEALLPKAKGIIFQAVLECLDTLVSENRASSDKVGVSTLFWSFREPGDEVAGAAGNNKNNKNSEAYLLSGDTETQKGRLELLQQKKQGLLEQTEKIKALVEESIENKEQVEFRQMITKKTAELRAHKVKLAKVLTERAVSLSVSPDRLRKMFNVVKNLTNNWTDNVFMLKDAAVYRPGAQSFAMSSEGEFFDKFRLDPDFGFLENEDWFN